MKLRCRLHIRPLKTHDRLGKRLQIFLSCRIECGKENGRLVIAELVDQGRFANTPPAIDNDALKTVIGIAFVQFSQLILTAVEWTHLFTSVLYS